ncbi:MAG: hypothetical protein GY866_00355 [Proteobacteria bacterium]|nr:hypothetical protein [Pseudomonadota bacterium]
MATIEENIHRSISKNGFPEKKVSLPFKAIFDACKRKGTTLSAVLKNLEKQEILNRMVGDKILFYSQAFEKEKTEETPHDIPDELYAEAMKKMKEMDPAEIEEIKKKVMDMSPEDQKDLMNKAEELFKQRKS